MAANSYTGAITAGTAVRTTPGTLFSMTFNPAAGAVVTIYDNASAATGTILVQKTFAAAGIQSLNFGTASGLRIANGLFAVVATAACQLTANVG